MGRTRLTSALAMMGVVALVSGGALIGTTAIAAAATPTLAATIGTSAQGTCSATPVSGSAAPFSLLCSNLAGGDVINLSGANFAPKALGSDVECNSDPSQPMVVFLGNYIPISCTHINIVSTSTTGTFTGAFTVKSGTTGPPAPGTPVCTTGGGTPTTTTTIPNCTTSGSGATDAANFPCPPTAAQQAAGDTCVLAVGDISGDRAVGEILFQGESPPGSTTTTTGASTSTSGATTTTGGATTTTSGSGTTVTGPFEIFCPGTPVGTIALNDVMAQATMSPANPMAGQQFNLTGYQVTVTIPQALASAAAAIQPNLTGTASGQIDATGATPATLPTGTLNFNVTIPSPVPTAGVPLQVPSPPSTLGPFTASSSSITMQQDSSFSLSLTVSGSPLNLTCTAYPNNMITPSGVTTATPTGSAISPVIAVANGGSTTTTTSGTTTTTSGTTTTTSGTTTTTSGTTTTTSGTTTTSSPSAPSGVTTTTEANECSSQSGPGDDHCQPPGCPATNQGQGEDHNNGEDNEGNDNGQENHGGQNNGENGDHNNGGQNNGENGDHNNGGQNNGDHNKSGENGNGNGESHDQNQGHDNGSSQDHSNDNGGGDGSDHGHAHFGDVSFVTPQAPAVSTSWGLLVGAALMVLGMVMLMLVDVPRRLVAGFGVLGGLVRRDRVSHDDWTEETSPAAESGSSDAQGLWHLDVPSLWLRPPQD